MHNRRIRAWLLPFTLLACSAHAGTSDLGIEGLIDVPSARMKDEGDLALSYASQKVADTFAITYQPTEWIEASFRYTIFDPYGVKGSLDDLKDRSFEAKVRLLREDLHGLKPQVAVGVRDLLGTGVLSGEYLVASKRVGPADFTLGLGWGRLSERRAFENPLIRLDDSFRTRDADTGLGGKFSFGNYFAGEDVGVFGGVRYALPRWDLELVAEYNSDSYRREVLLGTIEKTEPWSFAAEWEPAEDLVFSLSWQQGNQLGLRISSTLDTSLKTARKLPNGFGARGTAPAPASGFSPRVGWYRRLVEDAGTSGTPVYSAHPLDEATLNIEYDNRVYPLEADAVHRILSLAELYAPPQYRRIVLTNTSAGVHTHSISYLRVGQADWARDLELTDDARQIEILPALHVEAPEFETNYRKPNLVFSYGLGTRAYLFDPDDPFKFQLFARVNANVDFGGGYGASASWIQNLYSQFGDIQRDSNSLLPKVRSDAVRYLQEGESGIDTAAFTKRGQLSDDLYYLAFAGILEEMYGGVGFEVLYRPFGGRVALGANVMGVQQREFDRSLEFRDYETVTGHVSAYWASPFYEMDVALHAGRYLARDWGATLEVSKRFPNGWLVGAFATLTDVPFDEFGEGSFDKGLVFTVPFNSYLGFNTKSAYRLVMRPIQRDGGQRINGWGTSLWETHRGTSFDYLNSERARMIP